MKNEPVPDLAANTVRHVVTEPRGNWDTKTRCSCGLEFVSRCEMWKHQADAYLLLIDGCSDGGLADA